MSDKKPMAEDVFLFICIGIVIGIFIGFVGYPDTKPYREAMERAWLQGYHNGSMLCQTCCQACNFSLMKFERCRLVKEQEAYVLAFAYAMRDFDLSRAKNVLAEWRASLRGLPPEMDGYRRTAETWIAEAEKALDMMEKSGIGGLRMLQESFRHFEMLQLELIKMEAYC